jgi:hypothetical protein
LGPNQLAAHGVVAVPFKPQAITGTKAAAVNDCRNGTQHLWHSVLLQALDDATRFTDQSRASVRMDGMRAREWLTEPSEDFDEVCTLAGLEPSRVREYAKAEIAKVIANPPPPRKRYGWSPGEVPNFQDGSRDRWTPAAQESAKTDFSQNRESTLCP